MNFLKDFFKNFDERYDREKIRRVLNIIALALVIFAVLYSLVVFTKKTFGIGVIRTQSIDAHIIIYDKSIDKHRLKDEIVFFLLPKQTPYFPQYSNFAKYVRCEGGDKLSVKGLNYFCNDKFIGTAKTTDKNGKSVEPFVYDGFIPEGQYFVMGTHERSYDSRYWGFVDYNLIKGVSVWKL